jgi:hypothetical protein
MSIALIMPSYAKEMGQTTGIELLDRFRKSMGTDVEELLIERGYTLKGPFDSADEMLFNDKKDADIAVYIEVRVESLSTSGGWTQSWGSVLLATNTSEVEEYYEGTLSLGGKIVFSGIEPLTGEKIWAKSLEIPKQSNIKVKTEHVYSGRASLTSEEINLLLLKDPSVHNALVQPLQNIYQTSLSKIENYFEPEELRSLKPQIKELKAKKGF